ncbi:LysR family transcriptional regulator [Shewanella algicola]|uniref:LysR family transcriptional regulator n=1 Tax=Shewanella algicola TaxID=640633 RepID=A0A9X1Z7A9_9GAMM|nr:LysR family transcriptional regulator [Shewanella algicola]MCL1107706.1 LysR family transcriptional regulator [Shewanella algicola]GGP72124.1 LysR family transcriptional regulator [Shewanella algicola]
MKKPVNLSDIKTFVVLAEQGSFTKAGEKLQCSRSHISKQLAQLEANLGVSLLIRTTRTQHLTPQGEVFFERCKSSLNGISHAIDSVLESANVLSGHIKINCVGGMIAENIIASLVSDFMSEHPDISIDLDFSSHRVDLISGEFDFVFRMGKLADSSLIARKLTDLKVGIYASPEYLSHYGTPVNPKELTAHKCINGSVKNWLFINNKTSETLDVFIEGNLTCKNGRIMISSAIAGNGIIRVPSLYCKDEVEKGLLIPLFDEWYIDSTPFYLVYTQEKHKPMRLKIFKDYVVANFSKYLT